jgi:uncharacterized membrane protein YgdD (TMEM256/DUF423 family)
MMSGEFWLRVGAISGAMAVAMGAFGAHGLRQRVISKLLDPHVLDVFDKAAQYQMYHSLTLLAVGILALTGRSSPALAVAGWGFLIGIVLFSGSLYAIALTGISKLGAITPIGGVSFLVGWVALAWSAWEGRTS